MTAAPLDKTDIPLLLLFNRIIVAVGVFVEGLGVLGVACVWIGAVEGAVALVVVSCAEVVLA